MLIIHTEKLACQAMVWIHVMMVIRPDALIHLVSDHIIFCNGSNKF